MRSCFFLVSFGFDWIRSSAARAERAESGTRLGDDFVRRFNEEMPAPKINDNGVVAFAADVVGKG